MPLFPKRQQSRNTAPFSVKLRGLARAAARPVYMLVLLVARPLARYFRAFMSAEILKAIQLQEQRLLKAIGHNEGADVGVRTQSPMAKQALRIVHQFHAGSATGDAITNSMFLIQRLLQRLGFESEIFVQHRAPEFADCLRPMDELPQHPHYVLLVHHSMGFDGFDSVKMAPAGKILVYHNITPAELFPDDSYVRRYIMLGHEQLRQMQPMVSAALADSEFNAIELRRVGYDPVHVCVLLFDIAEMLTDQHADATALDDEFTVLFVGRVVPSKGQADLVDAFAAFQESFGKPCRLVLLGRQDDIGYVGEVRRRAEQHGLGEHMLLTGAVPDRELHEWYRRADLYVSLSHHEGFGVPLVEAMAHGIPVIAWPAGAVPYTLDGAGELLTSRDSEVVATAMIGLATDAKRRKALVDRQFRSLERFHLKRQLPHLLAALRLAGASPAETSDARRLLAANMCFTITGHAKGTYSLAMINRIMALALEARVPGKVRFLQVETNPVAELSGVPPEHGTDMATLAARPKFPTGPHVVISQHYPPHIPPDPGDLALALLFWEETLLPQSMVDTLNHGFNGVLAPSTFVAKALIDSGVSIPVVHTGQPVELERFFRLGNERWTERKSEKLPFTFLHVSSCFPRKGVDVLLAAYAQAFTRDDPVRLVIKGFPNPHNHVADQLAHMRSTHASLAEIEFINQDIEQDALLNLYRNANAAVLPTRGEGFNLPAAEAMAAGVPLIVTGYGGHLDFCTDDEARFVDYRFERSRSHVSSPHSLWVEPNADDLAAAMREIYEASLRGDDTVALRAARAQGALRRQLDSSAWSERLVNTAVDLLLAPPTRPLRLGWVSSWDVRCGIASYSSFLLPEMLKQDETLLTRTVILADHRPAESHTARAPRVRQCWSLGDDGNDLIAAIAIEDVDVLVIQHQPGLITFPTLARVLQDRQLRNRNVIVALHAVPILLEINADVRQSLVEALKGVSRVLVHTVADLHLLKGLGVQHNVTLFPHGVAEVAEARPARALPSTAIPLIGSYGFFLPGKGISELVEAVALLQQYWPGLRLRLVNAAYPGISATEIVACRDRAVALGIEQSIEWVTDFLPHEESIALLSECDLIVLPYKESKESASGAVRVALASGAPVATTAIRLFEELGDAVTRVSSSSSTDALADGLRAVLTDRGARRRIQENAAIWISERNWPHLARRFRGMLVGLHATAPRRRNVSPSFTSTPDECQFVSGTSGD